MTTVATSAPAADRRGIASRPGAPPPPAERGDEPAAGPLAVAGALRAILRESRAGETPADLGLVDATVALGTKFLAFDAADPGWPDRDRLLVAPEQHALLDALARLSAEPPNATLPPLGAHLAARGEALGVAVGMALAERLLAARFGRSLVDHRTWVLAGGPDLAHGISHEAASLAGLLRLERLTVLWDADAAIGEGVPAEDAPRRFAACGWTTRTVDAADHAALAAALGMAVRSRKPTLLACRGAAAAAPPAPVADIVPALHAWRLAGARGAAPRRAWLKRLTHHPRRAEFERVLAGVLPATLPETLARVREALASAREPIPTGEASARVLEALLPALPELIGGSADQRGTSPPGAAAGRWLHFGARAQGLAAAMDGMAAHGGLLPVGDTACAPGEAPRPAPWRAAKLGLRGIHVLTGADPLAADQLAALRAVPNLLVLHPADALETAECWEIALRRESGPSLLVLGREARPPLRTAAERNCSERGGYVLAEAQGERRACLIATGAAVALAMAARSRLAAERIFVAVVSLPCWALFAQADAGYRAHVLGDAARFGIESGAGFGWERWLGDGGTFIGGAHDLSAEAIAGRVRERLATTPA